MDGHDLRTLAPNWIRQQIGIVSQEPNLFDLTIRENIAYGDNSREIPLEEIIEAAKEANVHDFVKNLPQVGLFYVSQIFSLCWLYNCSLVKFARLR